MSLPQTHEWKNKLPACFGDIDKIFAGHAQDEKRAKTMMRSAFDSGATIDDLLSAIREHLAANGASKTHIDAQLDRARALPFGVD